MCTSEFLRVNKQNIFVFFMFYGLFSTVVGVELSSSNNINKNINGSDSVSKLSEIVMNNYVATTPKIDVSHTKAPSRYVKMILFVESFELNLRFSRKVVKSKIFVTKNNQEFSLVFW